jgi:hypothetical protein
MSVDQTIDGLSKIVLTPEQNITGVANIFNHNTNTHFGLSAIRKTQTQLMAGVARICHASSTRTISGKAYMTNANPPAGEVVSTVRDPEFGGLHKDLVFYGWDEPTGVTITSPATIDVGWIFFNQWVADFHMDKMGTLEYSPDAGETWHVISEEINLYPNTGDTANTPDGVLPGGGCQISTSDLGSLSDTYYLRLTINGTSISVQNPISFILE